MRKKGIILCVVCMAFLWMCSLSLARENEVLSLTILDEKVSAEIKNALLGEILQEIAKSGIKVDTYEGVDRNQLISAKFKDLSLDDAWSRLFDGISFFYAKGKKLVLLSSGAATNTHTAARATQANSQTARAIAASTASRSQKADSNSHYATKSIKNVPPGAHQENEAKPGSSINAGGIYALGSSGNLQSSSTESSKANQTQSSVTQDNQAGESNTNSSSPVGGQASQDESQPSLPENNQSGQEQAPVSLNVGEAVSAQGGKVTIPISLNAMGQIVSALSNDLTYDPSILANPKVAIGEAGSQAQKKVVSNEIRPGLFRVGVIGFNQTVIPDGVVAYVTFDVLKDGPTSINNKATAASPDGKPVSVIVE